jgi:hypothetical protein
MLEAQLVNQTTPPFRADHVGSLLRPAELLRARAERDAGRMSPEELRAVEDEAIRDVVRMLGRELPGSRAGAAGPAPR